MNTQVHSLISELDELKNIPLGTPEHNDKVDLIMNIIKSHRFDENEVDEYRNTPLILLCSSDYNDLDHKIALELIKTGKSSPGKVNANDNTALMLACFYSLETIALAIIATGRASFEREDFFGYTALMYACENKLEKVALALIATGRSNPGQAKHNGTGYTALMYACANRLEKVALALIATGKSNPGHVVRDDYGIPVAAAIKFAIINNMESVVRKINFELNTNYRIPKSLDDELRASNEDYSRYSLPPGYEAPYKSTGGRRTNRKRRINTMKKKIFNRGKSRRIRR